LASKHGADVGVRDDSKQATRRRVLDAARLLFDEVGYEAATVRGIARVAGVSVGSVFTTFTSKADILSEVMKDGVEGYFGELERLIPLLRGSTADRLRSVYAFHCAFEMRRPKLWLAHIAAAYNPSLEPGAVPAGRNDRMRNILIGLLRDGVSRGEVCPKTDLELAVQLLAGVYLWNYARVAREATSLEQLTGAMDLQIGVIFEGLAPRVTV
jgi:AcrR family transcriptional regulator